MRRLLLLALVFFALHPNVFACSCIYIGGAACQAAWREGTSAVFLGRVEKIESYQGSYKVAISVEESYIGTKEKNVTVFTAESEAGCGYTFEIGERYVVYAYTQRNELHTGLCSATVNARYAAQDIAYLRSIPHRSNASRVFGELKRYTYDPSFKPGAPHLPSSGRCGITTSLNSLSS